MKKRTLFLSLLYFLLQYVSKLRDESLLGLKHGKVHLRNLTEDEQKRLINSETIKSNAVFDKLWLEECINFKSILYDLDKKLFWNWKRVCIVNNIHFAWDVEKWNIWKNYRKKEIIKKFEIDIKDYQKLRCKNPNSTEISKFIKQKKNSFNEFTGSILKDWELFLENAIHQWNEEKEELIKNNKFIKSKKKTLRETKNSKTNEKT